MIGGTAGPIMRPMSRNSQLRSIPAALNMQDRPPVREQEAKAQEHTPGEGECDRWHSRANQQPHEQVEPVQVNACYVEDAGQSTCTATHPHLPTAIGGAMPVGEKKACNPMAQCHGEVIVIP